MSPECMQSGGSRGGRLTARRRVQVLLPQVLRVAQPDMKLVVMMRDPVERFQSAYWYYGCMHGVNAEGGMGPENFHDVAEQQVSVVRKCMDKGASARQCARESFNAAQQIVKGMYAAFAPDWLANYPEEQIMWIRSEDYYANERLHLEVCARQSACCGTVPAVAPCSGSMSAPKPCMHHFICRVLTAQIMRAIETSTVGGSLSGPLAVKRRTHKCKDAAVARVDVCAGHRKLAQPAEAQRD